VRRRGLGVLLLLALVWNFGAGIAHADRVLAFKFTPAPRVQIAIWIEAASGQYLATAALTEAVALHGIGNRPGASEMNSGYRWPYGRREGALPIWAHRRASSTGAKLFKRVIFQDRVEGLASRTKSDQSADNYYCLQFDNSKSSRDQLDAVSCASAFNSDKGRYMTADDAAMGYFEPWEDPPSAASGQAQGRTQALPMDSYYPPRMDLATRCDDMSSCFDTADVMQYAADAREIMPEIDAIAMASPPGDAAQTVLFSVPGSWEDGDYVAYIEVNLEGDYNTHWNATSYPTPMTPDGDWDYYSQNYGYAYRGQPSLVWKLPFTLGAAAATSFTTDTPVGRSSWDYWSANYGELETVSFDPSDPQGMTDATSGGGTARLRGDPSGVRFALETRDSIVGDGTGPSTGPVAGTSGAPSDDAPDAGSLDAGDGSESPSDAGVAAPAANGGEPQTPGSIEDLHLSPYPNRLRAHTWVMLHMQAARSVVPLASYDVRVALEPIVDETSFMQLAHEAKNATDSAEGATRLTLPVDAAPGQPIDAAIGDLAADTHYWVGVRATNEYNQHGPISVAQITTSTREFATVSPCFVATAAYGSPLVAEVSVLRRVRDRYLLPQALGRSLVAGYYRFGARLAEWIAPRPTLRAAARTLLSPLVALAQQLNDAR
jgi:hypothetical protein